MMKLIRAVLDKLLKTGFFHIVTSSIFEKIIIFLSGIILVRLLSKEDYGIYTYAFNIYSFFFLAAGLGMNSGVLQLCSENEFDKSRKNTFFQCGKNISFLFNICLGIFILLVAQFVPLPIKGANQLLAITSFFPVVIQVLDFQKLSLRLSMKNQIFSYSNILTTLAIFFSSIIGAWIFGAAGLLWSRYFAYGISIVFVWAFLKQKFTVNKSWIKQEDFKLLLKISITSFCTNAMSQLLYLLDVFILGILLLDETIIADYKIATVIPTALLAIPSALVVYIYPYFARKKNDKKWVKRRYIQLLLATGALNCCISSFLILFAPFIIQIIFGKQYMTSILPFRILAVNYFFSATFRTISGNLLITQRQIKYNFYVSLWSGIGNIIADVVLIRYFGSTGAAIATLLIVIFTGVLSTGKMFSLLTEKKKDIEKYR